MGKISKGTMEEEIKKAIDLLCKNGYYVKKIPGHLCETAEKCCKEGIGDCMNCSCFLCLLGNE